MNPLDFVITRKRKKYRFALFREATNCYELDAWRSSKVSERLFAQQALTVEVGAGTGLFLVEVARRHPGKLYIALDVKADRLQKGAREALKLGLDNIWFVRARADQLLEVVQPHSVQELWLTFSDPFPRRRDAKRRLTHAQYLEMYRKAHVDKNARINIKTDDQGLFHWTLEQLVATKWRLRELAFDLHNAPLSAEYKIMTTYERRWTTEGRTIYFVAASR